MKKNNLSLTNMLHLLGSAADFCATIIGNGSILPFSQNVQVMKTVWTLRIFQEATLIERQKKLAAVYEIASYASAVSLKTNKREHSVGSLLP